jgi:probable rRNA maturation factor
MNDLWVWNRQRVRPVNLPLFRRIAAAVIRERLTETPFEIAIYLVNAAEIGTINKQFLNHAGSTDVITFPYTNPKQDHLVQGEVFISVEDAIQQSRQYRTSWQAELVRYAAHGILHLEGYDDRKPAARKRMKREEDRLMRLLKSQFNFRDLRRKAR